jgi:uncharacterized integral membrane protein
VPVPDEPDRERDRALDSTGPEPTPDVPPEAMPPEAAEPTPAVPATPAVPERPAEPRRSLAGDLAEVQRGRPERAFNLGAVAGAIVAVAAAVFVIQNNQSTQFDWLWFDFELPLWTALVGAMAVGVVLVVIGFVVHERRQRRIGRRQDAAGRLRRALGPTDEPTPESAGRGRRGFLRRFRRAGPGPSGA